MTQPTKGVLGAFMNKLKKNIERTSFYSANPWRRLACLVMSGAVGVVLYLISSGLFVCLYKHGVLNETYTYIHGILLGLPVFTYLWWLRTHDVREQISKTETQIQQNSLFNGIDNLSDTDPLKIDIGVAQLLALSKLNPNHDEAISLAFIHRLKKCPLTQEQIEKGRERLGYAQPIFEWLMDKKIEAKAGLTNCKLGCQDFTTDDVFSTVVKNYHDKNIFKTWDLVKMKLPISEADYIETYFDNGGGMPKYAMSRDPSAGYATIERYGK